MSTELQTRLWKFVRGDTPVEAFEPTIYDDSELEAWLGPQRYLDLISARFGDPEQVDAVRVGLRAFLSEMSPLKCECVTLPDLAVVDMGDHQAVFATLDESAVRGAPFWWLGLFTCRVCSQGWLVAQEERQNDVFCMRRLGAETVSGILARSVWPDEFDKYENLLVIGRRFGRSVRFVDPRGSSSLAATLADLARDRPGIKLSELCTLLNLERKVAEELAHAVVAAEHVDITFDAA
jgi:hypothetical protein